MTELDTRARALLQAFREQTSPPHARVESELAAVERRIVASSTEDHGDDEVPTEGRAPLSFYAKAAGLAVAIAAGVLVTIRMATMGVAALTPGNAPAHDAASDEIEPPKTDTAVPVVVQPAEPPAVTPSIAPAPSAALVLPPVQVPATARASSSAPRTRDDLVAEVALLREAKAERNAAAALALLDEHAREFPSGSLARERDVLRAERLCTLGRTADARALADRFLADRGSDPLAQRMRRVCTAE